jgi:hypothetical protein
VIQCFTTLFDQRQKELKKIEKELQEAEAVEGKEKSRKMVFFVFRNLLVPNLVYQNIPHCATLRYKSLNTLPY